MKSIFSNIYIIFLVRIFLGGLFIVASLDKISDPQAFVNSILNYKIIGPTSALITATILPFLELLCGLGLILGIYPRASNLLITAMLVCFTIIISSALMRGLDISCGCFSQSPDAGRIGYQKFLENCVMIALALWLLLVPNIDLNITHLFNRHRQ